LQITPLTPPLSLKCEYFGELFVDSNDLELDLLIFYDLCDEVMLDSKILDSGHEKIVASDTCKE